MYYTVHVEYNTDLNHICSWNTRWVSFYQINVRWLIWPCPTGTLNKVCNHFGAGFSRMATFPCKLWKWRKNLPMTLACCHSFHPSHRCRNTRLTSGQRAPAGPRSGETTIGSCWDRLEGRREAVSKVQDRTNTLGKQKQPGALKIITILPTMGHKLRHDPGERWSCYIGLMDAVDSWLYQEH